jgi:hypothetical protein
MRSSLHRPTSYSAPQTRLDVRSHAMRGTRVAVIGDSKTFNYNGGWFKVGVQRSAKATWGGFFATQGYTLAQIQAVHLPSVLALSGWQKPAACVIDGFTNDINLAGYSYTGSRATLLAIANSLVGAGITPILATMPPRPGALFPNEITRWNAWIRGLGLQKHWPVIDVWSAVANASGGWSSGPPGLSADSIHPNGSGNRVIGTMVASMLNSLLTSPPGFTLSRSIGDTANLLASNAQLFSGTPSGGVASNWGASGTGCVFSVITTDTGIVGNWQTLNRPQAATANAFMHTSPRVTTGFSVGDRIALACLYQTSGMEANVNQDVSIIVNCLDASMASVGTMNPIYSCPSDCAVNAVAYDEMVVPAGTTALDVTFGVGGAATTTGGATLQVAQPMLYNLTALGIA